MFLDSDGHMSDNEGAAEFYNASQGSVCDGAWHMATVFTQPDAATSFLLYVNGKLAGTCAPEHMQATSVCSLYSSQTTQNSCAASVANFTKEAADGWIVLQHCMSVEQQMDLVSIFCGPDADVTSCQMGSDCFSLVLKLKSLHTYTEHDLSPELSGTIWAVLLPEWHNRQCN